MRLLRALLIFLRAAPLVSPPAWNAGDAKVLEGFLASQTGRKLLAIMRSEIAAANERAAMGRGDAFLCGWACGYKGSLAWFESLSAAAPAETGASEYPDLGSPDELGHLAPA